MALILVADDEADIASLLQTVLSAAGHEVHTARDGRTALDEIRRRRPDLSILDHYMPEMTGLDVAHTLRTDPVTSSLPLLMLSAAAPPTALLYCNVVLAKPVSLGHFTSVVNGLLSPAPTSDPLRDLDRVHAVSSLLDTYNDDTAARLRRVTAEIAAEAGAPMAAVNMVLVDAVAVYASTGLSGWIMEAGGMPADWTPCERVVRAGVPVRLDDLAADLAFAGTPLVTVSQVRSYAGVPLPDAAGHHVGTLSVWSRDPAAFTDDTLTMLTEHSAAVAKILMS